MSEDHVKRVALARELKELFSQARKPIVIEFAGVPKSGKSSTIAHLQTFFKRCGWRTEVVVERASVCPIRDKHDANFNVWTACTTLSQVLEKTQIPPLDGAPEILILDRGLFDAICWLNLMVHLQRLSDEDRNKMEQFILIDRWRKLISGVVLLTSEPEDSLIREPGFLPVKKDGSIMNGSVLRTALDSVRRVAGRHSDSFRIVEINTSSPPYGNDQKRVCEKVADVVLGWISADLEEHILWVSKDSVLREVGTDGSVGADSAGALVSLFAQHGRYDPRSVVESDSKRVQAIAAVVVRNKSGDLLRLVRREPDRKNKLHGKVVVWAGGHVRKEDAAGGDPLRVAAARELAEELKLTVNPSELVLVGAVYHDDGSKSSRHVAVVFEWVAQTDDVAIALCNAEFQERRGNSIKGAFVALSVVRDLDENMQFEEWSDEVLRAFYSSPRKGDATLF